MEPDEPPLPLPAVLLDTGLAETAPLVPPNAEAEVVDPPVAPDAASPMAPALDPPLDPPLEAPLTDVDAAGVGAEGAGGRTVG